MKQLINKTFEQEILLKENVKYWYPIVSELMKMNLSLSVTEWGLFALKDDEIELLKIEIKRLFKSIYECDYTPTIYPYSELKKRMEDYFDIQKNG